MPNESSTLTLDGGIIQPVEVTAQAPSNNRASRTSGFGDWLSALIGGGFNLLGDWLSDRRAEKAANKQYERQIDMFNRQVDVTRQLRNEDRDYNSPANQRKLLEDSGLNPAAVLSNGVQDVTSSSSAPSPVSVPGNDFALRGGNLGMIADTMVKVAQARLLNRQAENVEQDTSAKEFQNLLNDETRALRVAQLVADLALTESGANVNSAKVANINEDTAKKMEERLLIDIEKQLKHSEIDLNTAQRQVLKMQCAKIVSEIKQVSFQNAESVWRILGDISKMIIKIAL